MVHKKTVRYLSGIWEEEAGDRPRKGGEEDAGSSVIGLDTVLEGENKW